MIIAAQQSFFLPKLINKKGVSQILPNMILSRIMDTMNGIIVGSNWELGVLAGVLSIVGLNFHSQPIKNYINIQELIENKDCSTDDLIHL